MVTSLKMTLVFLLSTCAIYLILSIGLILSQSVRPLPAQDGLNFESIVGQEDDDQKDDPEPSRYVARDGTELGVRHYPGRDPDAPLIVVVHGSGWHGGGYTALGRGLSESLGATVLVPDLRGHGVAPVRRGDVDYVGQLEDDLADLITAYRQPEQPVYMVGHSSGGGLTIRFAGGAHGGLIDKAVLIAPYLHYAAPTARSDAGGWSRVLVRRLIGQSMLNAIGITALDRLHMIQFNFPDSVLQGDEGHSATQSYSYRLNTSFAPRNDYLADVAALPEFLLIAGRTDEAFHAEAYEPTMRPANANGQFVLVDGADHLGVLHNAEALSVIASFLK
jgi:alpha-beta hydrolase superfamily lysophospholipase